MEMLRKLADSRLSPFKAALGVILYRPVLFFIRTPYRYMKRQSRIIYNSVFKALVRPSRSAITTLLVPSEICVALGVSPLMIESLGGILGSLGMTDRFLHTVSQAGLPESLCTFHKMHLAFALEGGFATPRFTLAASALCDGNLRALQLFTDLTESDFYFFDFPHPDQEGAVTYLASQFEKAYAAMAESMAIRNPLERLKKAVRLSEEARKWLVEINERRKTHHFPRSNELIWSLAVISTSMGTEKAIHLFRDLYRELIRKGKPIPPETKRLLLIHLLPVYKNPVFENVFKKNVVISMEEYLYTDWPVLDPENPFESIASRLLSWSVMAPAHKRVEHINRLIDEYAIDGVISSSHWGCRQADGPIHALQSHIKKPFLRIETDLVDSNSASTGQLSTRIEGFLEMIGAH
jgi:benzoyl-CoA reductase/2-hydroxyglutaryl-CoA dehydratase subunit BcrC/BadD/HgdB